MADLTRIDRRPDRTRQALLRAFAELVLERGYGAVTVDQVVARANVGRSSLYVHFGGLEGLLKNSLAHPSSLLVEMAAGQADATQVTGLLEHFWDQRKRNKAVFTDPIRGLWVRRLAELIEPRLAALSRPSTPLPWSFIAVQVAECQVALVALWLTQRASTPATIIADALISTTRGVIDGLAPEARSGP